MTKSCESYELGNHLLSTLVLDRKVRIYEDNSLWGAAKDLAGKGIVEIVHTGVANPLTVRFASPEGGFFEALRLPENSRYASALEARGVIKWMSRTRIGLTDFGRRCMGESQN